MTVNTYFHNFQLLLKSRSATIPGLDIKGWDIRVK